MTTEKHVEEGTHNVVPIVKEGVFSLDLGTCITFFGSGDSRDSSNLFTRIGGEGGGAHLDWGV